MDIINKDTNTEQEVLKNAIRMYVTGKNQYNTDKIKAKEYFIKSLDIIKELKNIQKMSQYSQLIQSTEAECIKYLKNTNVFEMIRMNDIENIKKLQHINFREINDAGNTALHYAIDVGDTGILKELLKKGGMIDTVNGHGNTLLEYACLKKDPNVIAFMILHGANMKKHLFFRKGGQKNYLNKSDIDIAILLKLVISNRINKEDSSYFHFVHKYMNITELVGLDRYNVRDVLIGLHHMFYNKESYHTYKQILIEELDAFNAMKNLNKCIYNMVDIMLINLIPFINYPFNISSIFIVKEELKWFAINILKKNKNDFKNMLMNGLFEQYIMKELFPEDYIGIIMYNILSKN